MIKNFHRLLAAGMLSMTILSANALSEAAKVESVDVKVQSASQIPEAVRQRMEKSVQNIAEQLILAKDTEELRENSETYEKIIYEVFDKVLVGYSIQQVSLDSEEKSLVEVQLNPWSDVIKEIQVDVSVEGMSPLVDKMVRQDMIGIEEVFSKSLLGLPLGAADWSNGVLKQSVNEFMAENLPEFRADFDLEVAENTQVKLTVYPLLPVVRTLDLKMRSDTFPNMFLLTTRHKLQSEANGLIGVPVDFVKRHQKDFEEYYAKLLDDTSAFQHYRVHTDGFIEAGENMSLMTRSNTERLRIRGESWNDIGRHNVANKYKSRNRGHLGWMLTENDKVYGILEVMPQEWEWNAYAGYTHQVTKGLWAGVQLDTRHNSVETELSYDITSKWMIRHEYRRHDNQSEFGLRYKLHDFMHFEYVHDKGADWLRIIGNF